MPRQLYNFRSVSQEKFSVKEIDILGKNNRFFSASDKYLASMLEIINGESKISIRILDWFVTNYSKKNNTFYKIRVNGRYDYFYVNNEYKNQLYGYSKTYFDPFCRKKKIIYAYQNNNIEENNNASVVFLTSIGQLNFFCWAIRNKVIHYVELHIREIEQDMKETIKANKDRKSSEDANADTDSVDTAVKRVNNYDRNEIDRTICSAEARVNSICISSSKTDSDKNQKKKRPTRRQQSKSVYDFGIKKTNIPIKLDFD